MKKRPALSFRLFVIVIVVSSSVVTLLASGSTIFLIRSGMIDRDAITRVRQDSEDLARRTEGLLSSVEQGLVPLTQASLLLDPDRFSALIPPALAAQPMVRAIYFIDGEGITFAVGTRDGRTPRNGDFLGIDFNYNPLYQGLSEDFQTAWSDKFVSTLTGDTSVGAGVRVGTHAAIAELSLETLLSTVETATENDTRVWVIDRRGELVVDTGRRLGSGVFNVREDPVMKQALAGASLPETIEKDGTRYHPAASRSEKLGWVFIVGIPAGLDNALVNGTVIDIVLLALSFLAVAFILSPIWTLTLNRQVLALRALADRIADENADGMDAIGEKGGLIREFDDLSGYMRAMSAKIRERENDLRALNQELERRVRDRTEELEASNAELRESIDTQRRMQGLLVKTENLAALGRLVAGIAHEMNTPIGNAMMAISSLREELRSLRGDFEAGLRRSSLDRFLATAEQGLDISERNVARAADLVTSFKHVASDQTSAARRAFDLADTIRDVLLTLHPSLKRSPHTLKTELKDGVKMDSYPGVVGQIVANLVTNALAHAWDEGERGAITVSARLFPDGELGGKWARVTVSDDGRGIPEDLREKIFEPFFTTRMGGGGTGLGLSIAHNGAENVLGGTLELERGSGRGASFRLDIPLSAPTLNPGNEEEGENNR